MNFLNIYTKFFKKKVEVPYLAQLQKLQPIQYELFYVYFSMILLNFGIVSHFYLKLKRYKPLQIFTFYYIKYNLTTNKIFTLTKKKIKNKFQKIDFTKNISIRIIFIEITRIKIVLIIILNPALVDKT